MSPLRGTKRSKAVLIDPISEPGKTLTPNRTIDDSPVTEDRGRRTDLRDPLKAPGQLPRFAGRKTHLDADESYGDVEIPHRSGGEAETKETQMPKGSTPSNRPRGRKG
jgi:hypothetical protein